MSDHGSVGAAPIPFIRHVPGEGPADRIVKSLADAGEASLYELRSRTGLHAIQADNAVAQLIRQRRVRRVYSPDAVMRYRLTSLPRRAAAVTPMFAAGSTNRIDADVLGLLVIEAKPVPLGGITSELSARYDESTVRRSLARLKERGLVRCEGRMNQSRWRAIQAPAAATARTQAAEETNAGLARV